MQAVQHWIPDFEPELEVCLQARLQSALSGTSLHNGVMCRLCVMCTQWCDVSTRERTVSFLSQFRCCGVNRDFLHALIRLQQKPECKER